MAQFLENMRYIKVCLIFGLICGLRYSVSAEGEITQGDYLPFSDEPLPPRTPEPININTKMVKNIYTFPLILIFGTLEKVNLTNSGTSVTAILKSPKTSTCAYGGVLYHDFYVYARQKYYFTNQTGEIAGTSVDGIGGTNLETSTQYYKFCYGSFENALNYRDGIFEIRSRIRVLKGKKRNKDFDLLAPYLKKITKSGDSVEVPLVLTYKFFNKYPADVQYYAYPGAFTNETTNIESYCTTTIVRPVLKGQFISLDQYKETFELMTNKNGKPLDTPARQKLIYDRPIVSTTGILEFKVLPSLLPSNGGLGKF